MKKSQNEAMAFFDLMRADHGAVVFKRGCTATYKHPGGLEWHVKVCT